MHRATKIVATIGPASSTPEILSQMIKAGLDVVRLNFSHGTADDHRQRAEYVREAARQAGREVAIMADLQGPKIRVGRFENGKTTLVPGNPFVLDSECELGNDDRVGLDYKDLPRDLKPGDVLLLNDGLIVLDVVRVLGSEIHTTVKIGGELSNNKGINRQGGGLTAPALTAKDMEDIRTAMSLGVDYVAVSFPKNATDMEMARQLANIAGAPYGIKPKMIAKIERAEAIPALQGILDASDGIMVARGDLAVEVGNAAVPALQKRMIRMARESNKFVITATQMMESMIYAPVPTRAEVSDVANAVLDGTDAVMLSGADHRNDGRDLRRSGEVRTVRAGQGFPRPHVHPHRPVHRHGRAVHGVSPRRQGDCRVDGVGLDRTVDVASLDARADFRAHAASGQRARHGDLPQRHLAASRHQQRSRHRAAAGAGDGGKQGLRIARRHGRPDRGRADGSGRRNEHTEDRAGGRTVLIGFKLLESARRSSRSTR
jgi:thiamine monophosphate synthase